MNKFKIFLGILAFLGLSLGSKAQNYQTVNSSITTTFIGNDDKQVESIRIDSSFVDMGDSIFYSFYNIQRVDYDCYSPFSHSWIGRKIIIKTDGYNYFINREDDTVKINTFAQLNETWIAYETPNIIIIAEVIKHDTLSFLGQVDSAKTISFTAYDQNMIAISHPVNNKTIIISEIFGLLKTINFSLFSENTTFEQILQMYDLLGISSPAMGLVNLTWKEIYDFEIGDEFHIVYKEYKSYDYYSARSWEQYIYLDKIVFLDSVIYKIDRAVKTVHERKGYVVRNEYIHDTITALYKANPYNYLEKLSGEIIDKGGMLSDTRILMENIPRKIIDYFEIEKWNSNDTYWTYPTKDGCFPSYYYLKGFGGPYHYCDYGMDHSYRELQYYKKGNTTWGTPLSIGDIKKDNDNFVRVYPNPTSRQLTIEYSDGACPVTTEEYTIYSVMGQVVIRGALTCKDVACHVPTTINVESLANGMYYLKIADRVIKIIKN